MLHPNRPFPIFARDEFVLDKPVACEGQRDARDKPGHRESAVQRGLVQAPVAYVASVAFSFGYQIVD